MFKALKRWWKYMTAKVSGSLDERADPKVQIQQAISEAQEQHRRLTRPGGQRDRQPEAARDAAVAHDGRAGEDQRQRPPGADDAVAGDAAGRHHQGRPSTSQAAESIATRLIELEKTVDEQKTMVLQATQAADQAKTAVQQNSLALQKKLAERQKLLSQLDQAKMQEQLNTAMATLSESVGQDVPTFDEVRDKIEARYAKAKGMAELQGQTVENRMLEIEQATANAEAKGRLDADAGRARPGRRPREPAAVEPPPSSQRRLTSQRAAVRRLHGAERRSDSSDRCGSSDAAACGGTDEHRRTPHQRGSTTRSSRWIASWRTSGGSSARAPAGHPPQRAGVDGHHAPGEHVALGTGHVDGVALVEGALHEPDAGRQQRRAPLDQRPPGAVVDDDRARRRRWRRRSTACGPAAGGRGPGTWCPRRARRRRRRPARRAGSPWRSPACTPDHDAMRAAASFDAMPPLPRPEPVPPASASTGSSAATSSMSVAAASTRGSAVNRPGVSVRSTSTSAATRWETRAAMRSLSPKRISSGATASFSFTTGTQPSSSRRVSVWRAWRYWRRSTKLLDVEQHLGADDAVVAEDVVVDLHQAALAGGRQRLQRGQVRRARRQAEGGHAGRHRPARHDHDLVAVGAQGHDLLAQLHDGAEVDDAPLVGQRRRADLGHDGAHVSVALVVEAEVADPHDVAAARRRRGPAPCRRRASSGGRRRRRGRRCW